MVYRGWDWGEGSVVNFWFWDFSFVAGVQYIGKDTVYMCSFIFSWVLCLR